jgi:hypothetical protein
MSRDVFRNGAVQSSRHDVIGDDNEAGIRAEAGMLSDIAYP